ncbi:MAG: carbohydrate ABC transporter permease [PVC group bacterium]
MISPRWLIYLILTAGGIAMIFPFIWMVSTSLKSSLEVLSAQISLIPERKKYVRFDDRLEQVEFSLALELEREISLREGEIAGMIGSGISRHPEFRIAFSGAFSGLRRDLEKYFRKFRPRAEVIAAVSGLAGDAIRRLTDPILTGVLPPESRAPFQAELQKMSENLERIAAGATNPGQPAGVIILAGERRGEKTEVPLDEIVYKRFLWGNFKKAWQAAPFARYFFNSILVSVLVTIGQVFTSALAAYAFARMQFRFKEPLFLLLLATMMVPNQVILIPNYAIISWFRWVNTYYAQVVPFLGAVFGIYFMRQHFETLPQDLFDAAGIDGCGRLRMLFQIVLPISRSVILTVALFTFITIWNSLLWPLVMTNTPEMRPLQVGLAVFNQESGTDWELLMAASTFSILPLLLIFFIAQKQFIEGITRSGMKG